MRRKANHPLGPYSRAAMMACPDGRTKEAELLRETCFSLSEHLGGFDNMSVTQKMLVERAAILRLRLMTFDRKYFAGSWTSHDEKAYLAHSNSLARVLAKLGLERQAPDKTPTLADLFPDRTAAA